MDSRVRNTADYKKTSLEETLRYLETTTGGLSEVEVSKRHALFGYNEIVEKKRNPLWEFLLRYWGPMPWLLELAIGLSFLLRHYLEGLIIVGLLTVNAVIGHMHSYNSQKALDLLKKKLALKAKVLREGTWIAKEAKDITPGDIVMVKLGDIVPGDAMIVSGNLSMDQSSLTGESLPVEAHQADLIYSGSIVRQGEAKCVVVNTGANSYFGKTAQLVATAHPRSHQEQVMMEIVKYMMYLGIVASVLVATYALMMHMGILIILTFALIFLMGAVPVALPAVLTIVQAIGAMELSRKGVLVTRLDSIEDAASIDILCFDKTGTITQNKLSVAKVIPFFGYEEVEVIQLALFASKAEGMDPIDLAVVEGAKMAGVEYAGYQLIAYVPFDPSLKRTEAIVEVHGERFRVMKGAPQIIISFCRNDGQDIIEKANRTVEEFSRKGYRTIAIARSMGTDLDNLHLAGLLPLADPPRPGAKLMIAEAKKLGIKPLMLTGDNIAIAREIAGEVGIGNKIIRLTDIAGLSEQEQLKMVGESNGFAEIYPEDKYKIVKLLQSAGHTVGMTGDGVNDAPALKQAEMGIAMNNSTDVAKASASVVLTEPGIQIIIEAVKISRQTYQRMLTWVINKVTKVIEFVGLLTISFFWLHEIVLSLLGMSLLVFANDFVTMSLATDNVEHTTNPNTWNVRNITLASLIPGGLLVAEGTIVILMGIKVFHLEWDTLRTLVMLNLVFNSQFRILIVRERRHFWSSLPGRELLFLSGGTIIGFALLGISGIFFPSLTGNQVLAVLGFSILFTLGIDFPKFYLFRKFKL